MSEHRCFTMGELDFFVLAFKCSKCAYDFSTDEQTLYELYLDMVAQSKMQGEPQLDKYVDHYKQVLFCPLCHEQLVARIKFTKVHKFLKIEGVTYPVEQDATWIAMHKP
jgi:hypothetical protein